MVFRTSEEIKPVYRAYVDRFLGIHGVNSVAITTLGILREEAGKRGLEFMLSDEERPEFYGLEVGTVTSERHPDLPRREYREARLLYVPIGRIRPLNE